MDDSLQEQLLATLVRLKKMNLGAMPGCEIHVSELTIMRRIDGACPGSGDCVSVGEIQQRLHISKPAVSQTLNTLERKGYIVRRIDPTDRRKVAVTATEAGREILRRSAAAYAVMLDELVLRYGAGELEALLISLARLVEVFEQMQDELKDGEDG